MALDKKTQKADRLFIKVNINPTLLFLTNRLPHTDGLSMKWITPEDNLRAKLRFIVPRGSSTTYRGLRHLQREVGRGCVRSRRHDDFLEVTVDGEYADDREVDNVIEELLKDMEEFVDWHRVSYSIERCLTI